jgi:hypothetical protein
MCLTIVKEPETIQEYITLHRNACWRLEMKDWLSYEFVLRNGKEFVGQKLPRKYKLQPPKICFFNARQLVKRTRNLRYVEGYATKWINGIAVHLFHHAWAIDPGDQVIDPTINDADQYSFYGVPFAKDDLKKLKGRFWPMFLRNFDLIVERDPGMAEAVRTSKGFI